jgi:hypothetical protein
MWIELCLLRPIMNELASRVTKELVMIKLDFRV